jgi:hypothetical protein
MTIQMLNALLILLGPFLVVLPLAGIAHLGRPSSNRVRPARRRFSDLRFPRLQLEVTW